MEEYNQLICQRIVDPTAQAYKDLKTNIKNQSSPKGRKPILIGIEGNPIDAEVKSFLVDKVNKKKLVAYIISGNTRTHICRELSKEYLDNKNFQFRIALVYKNLSKEEIGNI